MSSNPYETMMPIGPFGKAVDAAIAEINAAFLSDPQAQAEAQANGVRWLAILNARSAVGEHGVVLPTALANNILAALRGEPTVPFDNDLLARMLQSQMEER